jgi:hypothetical protein
MANQKAATSKRATRSERETARSGEQIAMVVIMWLVPVALFAYVAIKVAIGTGIMPDAVMDFDFRKAAILVAIAFLVLAASLVLIPVVFPRKNARRAGPWDNKTSPGQLPGN